MTTYFKKRWRENSGFAIPVILGEAQKKYLAKHLITVEVKYKAVASDEDVKTYYEKKQE